MRLSVATAFCVPSVERVVRPETVPVNVARRLPCRTATPATVNVDVAVALASVFSQRRGREQVGPVATGSALLGSP